MWVRRFQIAANAKLKKKRLPENGDVDWATRRAMGIDEALADDEAIKLPEGVQAYQLALTASELEAGKRGERFDGRAYRVANLDKLLAALGLGDTKIGTTSDKRIAPLEEGPFLVPQGHVLYGAAADKSECAALVQSFGVSNTNRWRRGPRVQDIETLEPGTVIATLGSGVYLSDYSGKSHVGIFLRKDDLGLVMLDQFRGGEGVLGIRYKKFGAKHKRTRTARRSMRATTPSTPSATGRISPATAASTTCCSITAAWCERTRRRTGTARRKRTGRPPRNSSPSCSRASISRAPKMPARNCARHWRA
jgi:hypothetical protein